jgi:hypothetical protein
MATAPSYFGFANHLALIVIVFYFLREVGAERKLSIYLRHVKNEASNIYTDTQTQQFSCTVSFYLQNTLDYC